MSKGNTFETETIDHVLNNANIALIGDATGLRGSTTAGSLYLAAHTADPGEAGVQTTSECNYGSYARRAVARDGTRWTVASGQGTNAFLESFPEATSGTNTITHVSIGTASSGAGKVLYRGAVATPRLVTTGVTPEFQPGTIVLTED